MPEQYEAVFIATRTKSMRPYIDITESAKKDAIKKMEEAFKKK